MAWDNYDNARKFSTAVGNNVMNRFTSSPEFSFENDTMIVPAAYSSGT